MPSWPSPLNLVFPVSLGTGSPGSADDELIWEVNLCWWANQRVVSGKRFTELKNVILLKCSWFTMLCSFLLYSKGLQLYVYIHSFCILLHYGLSQDIEYSSLCYPVRPCCLSILYMSLHLLISKSQFIPSPPLSHLAIMSLYFMSVSLPCR